MVGDQEMGNIMPLKSLGNIAKAASVWLTIVLLVATLTGAEAYGFVEKGLEEKIKLEVYPAATVTNAPVKITVSAEDMPLKLENLKGVTCEIKGVKTIVSMSEANGKLIGYYITPIDGEVSVKATLIINGTEITKTTTVTVYALSYEATAVLIGLLIWLVGVTVVFIRKK